MPIFKRTGAGHPRQRRAPLPGARELGEAARGLGAQGRRRGGGRQQGPRLRLQPRRAPDDRVRPRGQLHPLLGRGHVSARARAAHRRERHPLLHRRRRAHRAQVHDRGKSAARARRSGPGCALHERHAVPPLHAHRALAARRHLRERRLRQRPRAQVLARRQAAQVLGRAGHRSRAVQHRAQHRHRRRGLGVRGRPREPPRAGVRRQRPVRDAVGEPASPVRPLLLRRRAAAVRDRRARPRR